MNLLFSTAYAASAAGSAAAADGGIMQLIILVPFIIVLYFVTIRPQTKRAKEQRTMIASIQKNDELVTVGGMVGKVVKVMDDFLLISVANGLEVVVQKSAIANLLPKDTLKTLQTQKTSGNKA